MGSQMSHLVQCECGHQFFTKKDKPQCTKCRKRFDVNEAVPSVSHSADSGSLESLHAKWKSQIQVVEGLMTRLKVEQTELNKISQQIKNRI